jgi:glycosyltransferase involved in cell wall biosynthesis
MSSKVSATLIIRDEEDLIGMCAKSIRPFVDELIVIDTGSVDNTVDIVKPFADKLIQDTWKGFGYHNNQALYLTEHDWVMIFDGDFVLMPVEEDCIHKTVADAEEEEAEIASAVLFNFGFVLPIALGGGHQNGNHGPLFNKTFGYRWYGDRHAKISKQPAHMNTFGAVQAPGGVYLGKVSKSKYFTMHHYRWQKKTEAILQRDFELLCQIKPEYEGMEWTEDQKAKKIAGFRTKFGPTKPFEEYTTVNYMDFINDPQLGVPDFRYEGPFPEELYDMEWIEWEN